MLRGNVPTRIRKLDEGQFDAIVLAAAGLTRLGMAERITQQLPIDISIPAVAQGVLGIETRTGDTAVIDLVRKAIHDPNEERRIAAERRFLAKMGGSCQTPLAAHGVFREGDLELVGMCGMPDGSKILRAQVSGHPAQAEDLGDKLADQLLARGAGDILAATK
jgi:hydroxymethylbilane synthase